MVFGFVDREIQDEIATVIVKMIANYIDIINVLDIAYKMTTMFDIFDGTTVQPPISCYMTEIHRKYEGNGPCVFGTKSIKSGVTIWRFKIDRGNHFYIGIINSSLVNNMNNFYKTIKDSYSLYGYHGHAWHNGKIQKTNSNWRFNSIYDPELCMCLDFNTKKLSYSINKGEFESVFDNIDITKEYKLAICVYGPKHDMNIVSSKHME